MFSEGVVSKRTKQNVSDQRANSKFGGIYSKGKRSAPEVLKAPKLMKAEQALTGADYFSQVLLLQNRETADSDLARLNEQAPDGSDSLTSKIEVARDIFENSTSREYMISMTRFKRAQESGGRKE